MFSSLSNANACQQMDSSSLGKTELQLIPSDINILVYMKSNTTHRRLENWNLCLAISLVVNPLYLKTHVTIIFVSVHKLYQMSEILGTVRVCW